MTDRIVMDVAFRIKNKVSIGASNVLASVLPRFRDESLLHQFYSKLSPELECFINELARLSGRISSPLLMNFDINRIGSNVKYVAYSSTIKGLLRSALDLLIIDRLATVRANLINDNDLIEEFIKKVAESPKSKEIVNEILKDAIPKAIYSDNKEVIIDEYTKYSVAFNYLLLLSPISCLNSLVRCSYPLEPGNLRIKKIVNDLILSKISKVNDLSKALCVNLKEGSRECSHCLPLGKLCTSCALFGAPGFESIIKVSDFFLEGVSQNVLLEPRIRVLSGKGSPNLYAIHYLFRDESNFPEPPEFLGSISIELPRDHSRLNLIIRSSYICQSMKLLNELVNTDIGLGEDELTTRPTECLSNNLNNLIKLVKNLVCLSLYQLDKSVVRLGRRGSLGYGEIEVICNECKELWDKLGSQRSS